MNNYYKYCLFVLGSFSILTNSAIASPHREQLSFSDTLSSDTIYISKNNASDNTGAREYTFKAPDNKILTNTEQLKAAQGYKVEVYGSAEELLLKIKNIEPRAFAKGNIIQVGIFKQQKNAEDLVRQLAVRGFWARITPL